jgi:hypothetical protein
VQLVDHLGHRHQLRHRAERLAAEVGVRAREDDAPPALGERRRELALRLYAPVLDYLYWCGVREAERDGTAPGAA